MTFKPVGIDEDSRFPARVEAQLTATYATRHLPIHHDFTKDAPGAAPTVLDSGQPVLLGGGQAPFVDGEGLTVTAAGSGATAGYFTAASDNPIRRIGCRFVFKTADPNSGSVVLVNWETPFTNPIPVGIPHAIIGTATASLDIYQGSDNGGPQSKYKATYTPVAADVVQTIEVFVDTDLGEMYLVQPDGSAHTVTDPRILGYGGKNPCWELFAAAAGRTPAVILDIWADDSLVLDRAGEAALRAARTAAKSTLYSKTKTNTTTAAPVVLSGAFQLVDSIDVVVPPSGRGLLFGNEYITLGGVAANLFVQALPGGDGAKGFAQKLGVFADDGLKAFFGSLDLTAFIPGDTVNVQVKMLATVSAGGTLAAVRRVDSGQTTSNSLAFMPTP